MFDLSLDKDAMCGEAWEKRSVFRPRKNTSNALGSQTDMLICDACIPPSASRVRLGISALIVCCFSTKYHVSNASRGVQMQSESEHQHPFLTVATC